MPGLLDNPKDAAMLQLGLGLLSRSGPSRTPISIGQALGDAGQEATQTYQQTDQFNRQKQMQEMQMQQYQAQMQRAAQEQENQKRKQAALQQLLQNPQIPQHIKEGVAAGVIDLGDLYKPQKLGAGDNLVSPIQSMMGGNGVIAEAPPKAPELPSAVREYEYAKGQGFQGTFDQWDLARRKANSPVNNIFNNTKDNFKNERDLRNDFQTLPTTKAFREVQSAYDQINVALKAESPAGDLAAATKIMKILDPGSVVRESELGMAMAATGALDRISNYANMLRTGQKLTPDQRNDFGKLAEDLYTAAESRYNMSADEYRSTASGYGLNPDQVAKPAKKSAVSSGGWSATIVKPK